MANDEEYEDDVELEKLRRRRFVFLIPVVDGTSSSVSSSVVLFACSKMFNRRFLGCLLLLAEVDGAVADVVVVAREDDDVSDLRVLISVLKWKKWLEL